MADYQLLDDLVRTESAEAALSLVRDDLKESSDFKREHWNPETLRNRWRRYHGDPESFEWPTADTSIPGLRPVHNLSFIQIRHKIGKLTRPLTRLTVTTRTQDPSPDIQFALALAKKRLEQKAKEANWRGARRTLARDAAVQSLGIRAVGVEYDGFRPKLKTWRVRGGEFYFDPNAEPHDLLGTARWVAWRRPVTQESVADTIKKFDVREGPVGGDYDALGDYGITLPDDELLLRGGFESRRDWMPYNRIMLTDYYRRDPTIDVYYQCSKCGRMATAGTVNTGRTVRPLFECQHCGKMETKMPARETMRQGARYPFGRHIRILGAGTVTYSGPCKLELEDVFPFVCMPWYEDEGPVGMGELEVLDSAQTMHSLGLTMLGDSAIYGAHPQRWIVQNGLVKPMTNRPDGVNEVTEEAAAQGGIHQLDPPPLGEAAKIIISESKEASFTLAGNDPVAHGTQPSTVRSGVGIGRIVAASEVSLYTNQDVFYEAEERFFRIVRDICKKVDYSSEMWERDATTGMNQKATYDRMLMNLIAEIQVSTEAQVDQEREELFSRAVELKSLGDPSVTWDMLHRLSGIPADMWMMASMEAEAGPPPGMKPIDMVLPGASGAPPLSVVPGGRDAAPAQGGGPDVLGAGRVRQESAGRNAPQQTRPPSRSRGGQTPSAPRGGGGGF